MLHFVVKSENPFDPRVREYIPYEFLHVNATIFFPQYLVINNGMMGRFFVKV